MQTDRLRGPKDHLLELRRRLVAAVEQGAAVVEDISPPGAHESPLAEDMDADAVIERTEAWLLNEVNAAIDRIETGSYGRCLRCGGEIAAERLKALPYAAYCVTCERDVEDEADGM